MVTKSELNNQAVEIRRLAALYIGVVNKMEEILPKLREGFVEYFDAEDIQKRIQKMQIEILQIDSLANDALNSSATFKETSSDG